MYSEKVTVTTPNRTTEHTVEVVFVDGKFSVKSTTLIIRHSNERLNGRQLTTILGGYKTERGATGLAKDMVSDYTK